jgi:hypothetical protein
VVVQVVTALSGACDVAYIAGHQEKHGGAANWSRVCHDAPGCIWRSQQRLEHLVYVVLEVMQ